MCLLHAASQAMLLAQLSCGGHWWQTCVTPWRLWRSCNEDSSPCSPCVLAWCYAALSTVCPLMALPTHEHFISTSISSPSVLSYCTLSTPIFFIWISLSCVFNKFRNCITLLIFRHPMAPSLSTASLVLIACSSDINTKCSLESNTNLWLLFENMNCCFLLLPFFKTPPLCL